jgi:pimeloyl-ACP methyl ester carboxylesterase
LQGAAALKPLLAGVAPTPRPEDVEGHPESCLPAVDKAQLTGDFGAWLLEAQRLALAHGTDGWQDDDLAIVSDWGFDLRDARSVAIWHGGQDRLVPPAHGAWLADHIPGARLRLLASEGHLSIVINEFERILDDLLVLAR